jgi:hypothetical protein
VICTAHQISFWCPNKQGNGQSMWHVWETEEVQHRVLVGRTEGKRSLEDGRIILKWIFKQWDGQAWAGLICLRIGQVAGPCECDSEPSGSIERGACD